MIKCILTGSLVGNGYLRTGPISGSVAEGGAPVPGGGLRVPARQRITWEDENGEPVANVWMFDTHGSSYDSNFYPELVWTSARHCYYWSDGFQLGNSASGGAARGWRFCYFNPLGQAKAGTTLDTQMESVALLWGGQMWDGSTIQTSYGATQYVPTGAGSGKLGFWVGGLVTPGGSSAYGRILGSSGYQNSFNAVNDGLELPNGKSIIAPYDFKVQHGAVVPIQSDTASAVGNTLRITNGKTRLGANANLIGSAAFPFEVAVPVVGVAQTTGDFYVDTLGNVYFGRLSATSGGGSGRTKWQNRLGVAQIDFDAGGTGTTPTATFATLVVGTNTTESTSTTTGAVKTSGGMGILKNLHVGGAIVGGSYIEAAKLGAEPSAPATDKYRIYAVETAGVTQLKVKFANGVEKVIANDLA